MTQENLKIHNTRFISYSDEILQVDVLGGVDTMQIERMICTLRITYQEYPPIRSTLDLYNGQQTDKLIRNLCDKWNLKLLEASKSLHNMTGQLESYKLQKLKYPKQQEQPITLTTAEEKEAISYLKSKKLIKTLQKDLEKIGILGEEENALILFLAMASHRSNNPFSVLCIAGNRNGKSYLLQKLSDCLPKEKVSYHSQISENALYYFDSGQLDGKVLMIEDLEWTHQMLNPLSTLQTQGKLIKTRATKDKDGMLHSTSFELTGKLCLLACAYSNKNYDSQDLPFLCLHQKPNQQQDQEIMNYQKQLRAGLINEGEILSSQKRLKNVISSLNKVRIINPYAPLIELPEELPHPKKTLLMLLNFMDTVTFFHQHQRETVTDKETGEIFIKTHPTDVELTIKLLKESLFNRADELSSASRKFLEWLQNYVSQNLLDGSTPEKSGQAVRSFGRFTALDIRSARKIHPRTLNRYLKELTDYHYLEIVGGNKHRGGYRYKIATTQTGNELAGKIETSLEKALKAIQNLEKSKEKQLDS